MLQKNRLSRKSRLLLSGLGSAVLVALLIVAGRVLLPVAPAVDPFAPKPVSPTPAPSDWLTPGPEVQPVTIEPLAISKVPARPISLPTDNLGLLLEPTPDGGCLAVVLEEKPAVQTTSEQNRQTADVPAGAPRTANSQTVSGLAADHSFAIKLNADSPDAASQASRQVRLIRYRADGRIRWEKLDSAIPGQGCYLTGLCVFGDGSFAYTLRSMQPDGHSGDQVRRRHADGQEQWQADMAQPDSHDQVSDQTDGQAGDQMVAGYLEYLFAASDGAVLAAGSLEHLDKNGTLFERELAIWRFSGDGTQTSRTVSVGAANYLTGASYSSQAGLIVLWRQDSVAGTTGSRMIVSSYRDELKPSWVLKLDEQLFMQSVKVLAKDGGVLLLGMQQASSDSSAVTSGSTPLATVLHITPQGRLDWRCSLPDLGWIVQAAELADGRIVLGGFPNASSSDTNQNSASLAILSPAGQNPQLLAQYPAIIEQLIPTRDGGFSVVMRQMVRALPQPPYISSLWHDTAAVVAHYNRQLQLTWRRTIDRYPFSLRIDQVIATTDDRLLVG